MTMAVTLSAPPFSLFISYCRYISLRSRTQWSWNILELLGSLSTKPLHFLCHFLDLNCLAPDLDYRYHPLPDHDTLDMEGGEKASVLTKGQIPDRSAQTVEEHVASVERAYQYRQKAVRYIVIILAVMAFLALSMSSKRARAT